VQLGYADAQNWSGPRTLSGCALSTDEFVSGVRRLLMMNWEPILFRSFRLGKPKERADERTRTADLRSHYECALIRSWGFPTVPKTAYLSHLCLIRVSLCSPPFAQVAVTVTVKLIRLQPERYGRRLSSLPHLPHKRAATKDAITCLGSSCHRAPVILLSNCRPDSRQAISKTTGSLMPSLARTPAKPKPSGIRGSLGGCSVDNLPM
jgi:hypothetical protein